MKYLIYVLIAAFNFTSCSVAQKTSEMNEEIIIPEVDNTFEQFDQDVFDGDSRSFEERTKDSYIEYTRGNIGFGKVEYPDKAYFKIIKSFYPNGNLRQKGVMFNNGAKYGVWYYFDEDKQLSKQEDTDQEYKFTWNQLIEYCSKASIPLVKGRPTSGGIKTEIQKEFLEGKQVWKVSYFDQKTNEYLEVILSGTSGQEISRRELEFVGN